MKSTATPTQRGLAGITTLAVLAAQMALPTRTEASHLGSATASAGSAPPPSVSAVQSFQPDLFTGRATTAIPLAVPPGRKGLQPSLALSYSSSGRNGWVGVGWSLDVGYIERSTKHGAPKYDSFDTFTFMFQGVSSDLVQIPDGTYRAKDEGAFLRVEHQGVSGWIVTDKSGTRYLFGQAPGSRLQAEDGRIFRWALDKVLDPHGNTLTVTYTKDQQQLYPSQIRYTGHEPTSLAPSHQVDFLLEDRPDVETNSRAGFPLTTAKRLKTVETKATVGGVLSLARRCQLAYTQSPRTGRSLLSSVTQFGTDGTTSLPATTFTYTQDAPTYLHCHNCVPSLSSGNHGWQLQSHVGNLWAKDAFGNDQLLWPSGSWQPGVQQWSETNCKKRKCTTATYTIPIPQVTWSSPSLGLSGTSGGVSWSTDASGNLSVSGPQDSHVLAMTWLYTATAKTVSLSAISTSGRADVFYVAPGGSSWSVASGNQVPLTPGWTVVAVTAYNETGGFSLSMSANLVSQVSAMNHNQFSPMGLTGDFNGDGMTDLAHLEPATNHWHVLLNSVSGFGQEQTWLSTTLPAETVPLVGDVEADGQADLILWNASSGLWQVARSTGTSFALPATWHSGFGAGHTPFMGDVNGDQLLDVGTFSGGTWTMALSTGTGFGSPTTWLSGFGSGATPLTGDFNGDGLTDVAAASGGTISVALSDGTRLVSQPSAWTTGFGSGQALTSADLNGDGLTDLLYYDKATGAVVTAPSTGGGFGAAQALMSDHPFGLRGSDDVLQVGDFRGNGLSGFGVFNALSGAAEIAVALGTPPDLLETTANGLGGSTTLTYQPSSLLTNTTLPFALPVVTQTATADGLGHTYTTTYRYAGGRYDAPTKEFRGFQTATVTDAIGTTTTTTFSQDLHTKGRPLVVERRDSAGRLYTKTVNTVSCTEPFPGVHVTTLDQTDASVYDGDDTFRQVRSRFTYDPYGNLTQTNEDGEVSVTGDERTTTTTFLYNTTAWILNRPSLTQTLNASGVVVGQRRLYYDGATLHTTAPTAGLLTTEEEWLDVEWDPRTSHLAPVDRWLSTTLTYDAYGNVTTVTDALDRTTTNTYDPDTHTSLTQIHNVLGHTRQLAYDPRLGQVTSSTDQNGQTTTTEYDPLGRVTNVIGPTDTAALPTISYGYDLSTTPAKTTVSTRMQSGQPEVLTVYTFTDGLGRTLQTRVPAEDPLKQVVSGAVDLDARGLVIKQWVPYLDQVSSSVRPVSLVTDHSALATVTYAYDALGRLIQTTDPDGSLTLVDYDDGETTTTLANTTQTSQRVDAYGRLSQVEEVVSDTVAYATTYAYDPLNNLTTVTDHAGNLTTITYDSLGRKLAMDDPDMGPWTYAYDAVDNLTSQTDARGVTISFTYDLLNRLTQKAYADSPLTSHLSPVTYTYDTPAQPFSTGQLTGITDGSGSSRFEYDQLGRLTTETKTVDGHPSTVHRSYDLLGRLTSLTYPDGDVASYTYNPQGGIETVSLQAPRSTLQAIVSNVDYNAAGQLTQLVYGNGVVSDYTYHPQTLRLASLTTHTSHLTPLQDFSYTFDPVGNVTAITDRVHTGTQTFQYDALNRLTQAVGAYGTSTYAYDPIGNMTEKEGVTMTYGAGSAGPHAVTSTSDGWTMTYDANGNLTRKAFPHSLTPSLTDSLYSYDAENRLTEVKTAQEETVTLTFQPGWNFFSLPVIPDNPAIPAVLPNFATHFEQVSRYDGSGLGTHYVGKAKFDDFTAFEYGVSYQVYCKATSPVTVTITGKLPTTALSQALGAGWHVLPAVSLQPTAVSAVFGSLAPSQVLRYETTTGSLTTATQVEPGQAYYVQLPTASTWTPPLPRDPTTTFVYDGDGGRVKQITASGTTTYLGESYELAPDGTITKYVFAGSQRIAAKDSTGTLRFYHGDHLGSSNVITDGTGALVELNEHTPYGGLSRHEGTADVRHKFTGQHQDAGTGLILFPARAYDPALGRFLQPDPFVQAPADPQTLNRYSYARNNPVNLVDPTGYSFWSKFVASIAAVFTFVATGGNIALAAGVFGAVDGGISAYQAGAGWSGALQAAGIGFAAGFYGGGIGAVAGSFVGSFAGAAAGSIAGGAVGGASAGAIGAALSGGNVLHSAAAGAASGAVFGGTYNFSLPVAMMGSAVVGAVVAGADPVEALVEGAGSYAGTYVGGYAAGYASGHTMPADGQLEPLGVQTGDQLFFLGQPLDLGKLFIGLLEGPFSHTNIYVGNGRAADNSVGRAADVVPLTERQFQGRRFVSFRGAPGAANPDYNALTKDYAKANGKYNPAQLNICSTFCSAIYGAGGVAYPDGIGPNAQFINRSLQQ